MPGRWTRACSNNYEITVGTVSRRLGRIEQLTLIILTKLVTNLDNSAALKRSTLCDREHSPSLPNSNEADLT